MRDGHPIHAEGRGYSICYTLRAYHSSWHIASTYKAFGGWKKWLAKWRNLKVKKKATQND